MSQPPTDDPAPPPYYGPPATEGPPNYAAPPPAYQPPVYEPPPAYGQPAAYEAPSAYGQPPAYGQPAAYEPPPAYGQPPVYGQPGNFGPPTPAPPRKRRTIWILAALVALVLVAGVVAFAVTRNSGSTSKAGTADIESITVPDGPGVIYRSSAGHFADRFPEAPDARSINGSADGIDYTVYLAADTASHTVVEAAGFSTKLPADQQDDLLEGIVEGASSTSGLGAGATTDTTFQGHRARRADLTGDDGTDIALLAFIYSDQRIYLLFAPTGNAMNNLEASFVAVP
jgi:hypothetical protein